MRFECNQTGIGTGDRVRHKYDGRFGEVLHVYPIAVDDDDFLSLGRAPRICLIESSKTFAKIEFLIAWRFNGHPVIHRYCDDVETFLLEKR